ncbi:hypothetical protein DL767_002741 [Monosporascus sp. MG133]|nr:hypothetical protein DL767_002741 [Monosporascus sp. MG133]
MSQTLPETEHSMPPASRVSLVDPEAFFTIPDEEMFELIRQNFFEELGRLTRAYSIRDSNVKAPLVVSPSGLLYQTEYDEVNRTLVSLLALRWIHNDQYDTFVGTQPESVRLTRQSFDWVRARVDQALCDAADLDTLIISVVINDLGKDPRLASDYHERIGRDVSALNHDTILLEATKVGLVPCLGDISRKQYEQIIFGLELGSRFNFGQLAQAELAPACLRSLQNAKVDRHAFDLHFAEQLLDIAGASGHMDWTCAKKLIGPIADAYCIAYEVVSQVISGKLGIQQGFERVLTRRALLLHTKGFRLLSINDPQERALMRLLCMGGVRDLETAMLYYNAWNSLSTPSDAAVQHSLIYSLNLVGSDIEPAVQPTYMPALLAQAVDNNRGWERQDMRSEALKSALRYLARVMSVLPGDWSGDSVSVLERNVLGVVKAVVQTQEFLHNPSILEMATVPEAIPAISE